MPKHLKVLMTLTEDEATALVAAVETAHELLRKQRPQWRNLRYLNTARTKLVQAVVRGVVDDS